VSTGYLLSSAIIMPIIALLSSRFGRKRFYMVSVLLFTGASMLCGIAWDLTSMVIFRIIQGMGGGTLIPMSQALLRETFPHEEQGTAMASMGSAPYWGRPSTHARRMAHRQLFMALDLLHQRAGRRHQHSPYHAVYQGSALSAAGEGKLDFAGLFFMAIGLGALQVMLEKATRRTGFPRTSSDTLRLPPASALPFSYGGS